MQDLWFNSRASIQVYLIKLFGKRCLKTEKNCFRCAIWHSFDSIDKKYLGADKDGDR